MAKDERKFTVSLEGMLKIEETARRAFSAPRAPRPWATLDDVPEFALATMSQMYNTLVKPFEKSYGVVIYGPIANVCGPECTEWGRRVQLPTNEVMQLKFTPRTMLQEAHDGIAMISIRVTNNFGSSSIRTAILFAPELDVPDDVDPMRMSCGMLGPRGLHLMMMSFFKQHDPKVGNHRLSSASWTTDPFGYGSVRSTTFSITNVVPKAGKKAKRDGATPEYHKFDHGGSTLVAPGTSGMLIAAEIVNVEMPDSARRAAEPIHSKDWTKIMNTATEGICREDNVVGRSAIAASVALSELMSAEGIVGMLSNEFFTGAVPDKLHNPTGIGLLIAMSVRIAMVPGMHGFKAGSIADQIASAEVRSLFESQTEPIPFLNRMWSIDVALNMAKKNSKQARRNDGRVDVSALVYDQMTFWHRAGQSCITSIFGPGTSLDQPLPTRFGMPWRFQDPLMSAQDTASIELGIKHHHIRDKPRVNLGSVAGVRTQFIRMLVETEKYLRTGAYCGQQLQPKNDDAAATGQMLANQATLQELIMPQIKEQLQRGETMDMPSHKAMQDKLYNCYNMSAVSQATIDMTEALTAGPVVHFKHRIGSYLVSEAQLSPCCDCGKPVHVLQGVMFMYSYGECTNCHAKRCLDCSSEYGLDMLMNGNGTFGRKCRSCGVEPPRAHAERGVDPRTGKPVVNLHIDQSTMDQKREQAMKLAKSAAALTSTIAGNHASDKRRDNRVAEALKRDIGAAIEAAGLGTDAPDSP